MDSLTNNLFEATGIKCDCGGAVLKLNGMRVCEKCGAYEILKSANEVRLPAGADRFLILEKTHHEALS